MLKKTEQMHKAARVSRECPYRSESGATFDESGECCATTLFGGESWLVPKMYKWQVALMGDRRHSNLSDLSLKVSCATK